MPALALREAPPRIPAAEPHPDEEYPPPAEPSPALGGRRPEEDLPARVLLVDDERDVRVALRELLEDMGIAVVGEAEDGDVAISRVEELHPEVVLMDLRMPRMDGLEAARAIKERHPGVHVIILSAYDDPGLRRSADEAGVALYLMKGCRPWLIEEALNSAASLSRAHEARNRPSA